jgi:hypothetical protein
MSLLVTKPVPRSSTGGGVNGWPEFLCMIVLFSKGWITLGTSLAKRRLLAKGRPCLSG